MITAIFCQTSVVSRTLIGFFALVLFTCFSRALPSEYLVFLDLLYWFARNSEFVWMAECFPQKTPQNSHVHMHRDIVC